MRWATGSRWSSCRDCRAAPDAESPCCVVLGVGPRSRIGSCVLLAAGRSAADRYARAADVTSRICSTRSSAHCSAAPRLFTSWAAECARSTRSDRGQAARPACSRGCSTGSPTIRRRGRRRSPGGILRLSPLPMGPPEARWDACGEAAYSTKRRGILRSSRRIAATGDPIAGPFPVRCDDPRASPRARRSRAAPRIACGHAEPGAACARIARRRAGAQLRAARERSARSACANARGVDEFGRTKRRCARSAVLDRSSILLPLDVAGTACCRRAGVPVRESRGILTYDAL